MNTIELVIGLRKGLLCSQFTLIGMLSLALAGPTKAADAAPAAPAAATTQKAVLVTGASTGIGRKVTERLAADGYFVYAGARKDSDLAELDAIEAFGDSLAAEMEPLGVKVSLVEPGNYNSEIVKTAGKRLGVSLPNADRSKYPEPDDVADAVASFLVDSNPKRRYMVVPAQNEAEITIKKALQEIVQLNQQHRFTYDRKALIEMLDAELAAVQAAP
jgi:short-subunit dehydrogenase